VRPILPDIMTLIQHINLLESEPEKYRPDKCPYCGYAKLWRHGCYTRQADRSHGSSKSLNPIAIPRFLCKNPDDCKRTCSTLPECIPPHRHFPWLIQQAVLLLICSGMSYESVSAESIIEESMPFVKTPSLRTINRWTQRLQSRFSVHASHLRSVLAPLGRFTELIPFWSELLKDFSLSQVMLNLNNARVVVP